MPVNYNPTDANFLTVAQSRTNNGQRDVRVLLDITSNIFYTLDDDGVLTEIQSSGGGDLEQTLILGNGTGSNDIVMNTGTKIVGEEDATLFATDTNIEASVSSVSDGFNVFNNFIVENASTSAITTMQQYDEYFTFGVENDEKFVIDGTRTYSRNEKFELYFPLPSNEYIEKKIVFGGLNDFYTNDNLSVTIGIIEPTIPICRVKARISAYDVANNQGYYNEITAAFKLNDANEYVLIGIANELQSSDFAFAFGTLAPNQNTIQINVAGEGVGFDLGWVAQVEYSDQI